MQKAKPEASQLADTSANKKSTGAFVPQNKSLYGTFTFFTGQKSQNNTEGYSNPQAIAQNIELDPKHKAFLEGLTIESKPTSSQRA